MCLLQRQIHLGERGAIAIPIVVSFIVDPRIIVSLRVEQIRHTRTRSIKFFFSNRSRQGRSHPRRALIF